MFFSLNRIDKCRLSCLLSRSKDYWRENEKEIREIITEEQKSHVEELSKKIDLCRDILMKFLNSIFTRYKKCTTENEIEKCLDENLMKTVSIVVLNEFGKFDIFLILHRPPQRTNH